MFTGEGRGGVGGRARCSGSIFMQFSISVFVSVSGQLLGSQLKANSGFPLEHEVTVSLSRPNGLVPTLLGTLCV